MNNKPSASYQLRRPTLLTVEVIQLVEQMQIQQLEVSQTIITIKAQSVPHIKPHMLSSLEEYHKDRATAPLLDWTSTSPKLQQLLGVKDITMSQMTGGWRGRRGVLYCFLCGSAPILSTIYTN